MRVTIRALRAAMLALTAPVAAHAQSPSRTADSLFDAHEYQRAIAAYESLIRGDSTVARYWYQLGLAAANVGSYDRGAVAFARAAKLAPNPSALYNAGAMHARMHHADSAFHWLTQAVKMGFANPALLQGDEDLAGIRADSRFAGLLAAASNPPMPCAHDTAYRRFDFWVGDWDVTTLGGAPVGKSSVQSVSGGCALLENWTAGNGGSGKSLNSYNTATKQWVQFWVGSGGGITEYSESEWHNGAVTFHSRPSAPNAAFQRLTFTPIDENTVRQFGELSKDSGKTWAVGYDFYYHRRR